MLLFKKHCCIDLCRIQFFPLYTLICSSVTIRIIKKDYPDTRKNERCSGIIFLYFFWKQTKPLTDDITIKAIPHRDCAEDA